MTAMGLEPRHDNWIEFSGQERGKGSWEKAQVEARRHQRMEFRAKSLELKQG